MQHNTTLHDEEETRCSHRAGIIGKETLNHCNITRYAPLRFRNLPARTPNKTLVLRSQILVHSNPIHSHSYHLITSSLSHLHLVSIKSSAQPSKKSTSCRAGIAPRGVLPRPRSLAFASPVAGTTTPNMPNGMVCIARLQRQLIVE